MQAPEHHLGPSSTHSTKDFQHHLKSGYKALKLGRGLLGNISENSGGRSPVFSLWAQSTVFHTALTSCRGEERGSGGRRGRGHGSNRVWDYQWVQK